MSEKIRRQKDIVKNATESYSDAISVYQDYLDGASPIQITYYQISDEASRTDTSLDDTHEVIGSQSSLYYYSIKNVLIRGTSALDIMTQFTQRGQESFITGEFVMTPDLCIVPRVGEFFSYEDEINLDLSEHLFQITDVQYDKATSANKYYKCTFKLFNKNRDAILSSIVKRFVYKPSGSGNNSGVGDSVLISEETALAQEKINNLKDGLIDKFIELYYNGAMDTFTYQRAIDRGGMQFAYYWSPYLCHFIYKNKILEKSNHDFLTEIFIQDVNDSIYPNIYTPQAYKHSIFRAIEMDDPDILKNKNDYITSSFMEVSAYDLNKPLNLPFFSTAEKYYLIDEAHDYNLDFWMGAFNWLSDDETHLLVDKDKDFLYSGNIDDLGDVITQSDTKTIDDFIDKDVYYMTDTRDMSSIKNIFRLIVDGDDLSPIATSAYDLFTNNDSAKARDILLDIVYLYFSKQENFLTDDLCNKLNEYDYDNSFRNYILLPIIIYILQNYKGESNE